MRYETPQSLEAAAGLLAAETGLAKVLSGGTDLLVQMKSGMVEPDLVVDLKSIAAVREVLQQVGAQQIPEVIAINKADIATPETIDAIKRREPTAVVVSARTGAGVEELMAAVEAALPTPWTEVACVLPYARGDLLARAYAQGEVIGVDHGADGTWVKARVPAGLADELLRAGEARGG